MKRERRYLVSVVGNARVDPDGDKYRLARTVGRLLVEAGFRVVTGGYGGVMEAAMLGAREAHNYSEGDTVAILPSYDPADANPHADIVIATGLGVGRNVLVANCDAVVAGGRRGRDDVGDRNRVAAATSDCGNEGGGMEWSSRWPAAGRTSAPGCQGRSSP